MNRQQWIALFVGIAALVGFLFYKPYDLCGSLLCGIDYSVSVPPLGDLESVTVDLPVLFAAELCVVSLTGLALVLLQHPLRPVRLICLAVPLAAFCFCLVSGIIPAFYFLITLIPTCLAVVQITVFTLLDARTRRRNGQQLSAPLVG